MFVSGCLFSSPVGWQEGENWVRSGFEIRSARSNYYRIRLSLRPDELPSESWPDERQNEFFAAMGVLRYRAFGAVAVPELLSALSHAYRKRPCQRASTIERSLADRLAYEPQRAPDDFTIAAYLDLRPDELPMQPVVGIARSVLRYAPQTFPFADVELRYLPAPR